MPQSAPTIACSPSDTAHQSRSQALRPCIPFPQAPRDAKPYPPAGHATKDDQPVRGQIGGQPFRHAGTTRRRMPRTDHCNPRFRQCLHAAPYIKDRRRIVDLLQLPRVGRVIEGDYVRAHARCAPALLLREFERLAGCNRPTGIRNKSCPLQSRSRPQSSRTAPRTWVNRRMNFCEGQEVA